MPRQCDLFEAFPQPPGAGETLPASLPLQRHQLRAWQERLVAHQGPLFSASHRPRVDPQQGQLPLAVAQASAPLDAQRLAADPQQWASRLDPLALQAQSLAFWRWPTAPHRGAAIYLVLDRPPSLSSPLLLYVGETGHADQRWKGDHDCKGYLAAYADALHQAGLESRLSIRFCCDVPAAVRARRALEQALIRRWLPPFNKESRERWATPFRASEG